MDIVNPQLTPPPPHTVPQELGSECYRPTLLSTFTMYLSCKIFGKDSPYPAGKDLLS